MWIIQQDQVNQQIAETILFFNVKVPLLSNTIVKSSRLQDLLIATECCFFNITETILFFNVKVLLLSNTIVKSSRLQDLSMATERCFFDLT